jgi:hypothetical protein
LEQTIANLIPLDAYHPTWDSFWNQVAAEIAGRLPRQCRERYMPGAFLAQLTWAFLCISVVAIDMGFSAYICCQQIYAERPMSIAPKKYRAPFYVYLMTAEIALASPSPSTSLCYSLTHAHRLPA